jgi:hypothetical protein
MSLTVYLAPPGSAAPVTTETPTPELGWEGRVVSNTPWATNGSGSILRVHVVGQTGVTIEVTCYDQRITGVSGSKTEYGPYAAEFAPLSRGTYTVSLPDLGASLEIWVDGYNLLVVEFTQTRRLDATPTPTVGYSPTPAPTATIGYSLTSTPTPTPPFASSRIIGCGARPYGLISATLTTTPTLLPPAPTPQYAWQGQLIRQPPPPQGAYLGSIAVQVAAVKGITVQLTAGDWHMEGVTGSKPEYGDYAVEFGGLPGGTYYASVPVLATEPFPVKLPGGGFALVQFTYGPLPTATPGPTPVPGSWTGGVTSNTSGTEPAGGVWSNIIVKVGNYKGLTVRLHIDGFDASCVTGTKPEYGDGACEFGGLWPGTYRVTPEGLGPSITVFMDGRGTAVVEFWRQ